MLEVDQVFLNIGNTEILKNVSFKLEKKKIIGLVGSNGAGKSSTMKLITRFHVPDYGKISINGINISDIKREFYPVSYIPDEPIFYDFMTLEEHLAFVDSLYTGEGIYTISQLVEVLELETHLHKTPSMLSKGTKQKLMIAMSLLRNYKILIADEPFSGLDPEQIIAFKKILLKQKECEKTVLISTHLLNLVEDICDGYVMIDNGEIIATGTKEELMERYRLKRNMTLEECYLSIVKNRRQKNVVSD